MDEAGSHHPQQTDIGTEKQILQVLTHKWELNNKNIWTQRGEQNTSGLVGEWGMREGSLEEGSVGSANHHNTNIPM